jgi:hypothetical protein
MLILMSALPTPTPTSNAQIPSPDESLVVATYRTRPLRKTGTKDGQPVYGTDPSARWSDPQTFVATNKDMAQLVVRYWNGIAGNECQLVAADPTCREELPPGTLVWLNDQAAFRTGE